MLLNIRLSFDRLTYFIWCAAWGTFAIDSDRKRIWKYMKICRAGLWKRTQCYSNDCLANVQLCKVPVQGSLFVKAFSQRQILVAGLQKWLRPGESNHFMLSAKRSLPHNLCCRKTCNSRVVLTEIMFREDCHEPSKNVSQSSQSRGAFSRLSKPIPDPVGQTLVYLNISFKHQLSIPSMPTHTSALPLPDSKPCVQSSLSLHTHTHTHIRTHKHTCIHTYTHTHTHIRTHTYVHREW